jgi:hypothetical protein
MLVEAVAAGRAGVAELVDQVKDVWVGAEAVGVQQLVESLAGNVVGAFGTLSVTGRKPRGSPC